METIKKKSGYFIINAYNSIAKEFYQSRMEKIENQFVRSHSLNVVYVCENFHEHYQDDLLKVLKALDFAIISQPIEGSRSIEEMIKERIKEKISTRTTEGTINGRIIGLFNSLTFGFSKQKSIEHARDAPNTYEGILEELLNKNPRLSIMIPNATKTEVSNIDSFATRTLNSRSNHEWKIMIILVYWGRIKASSLRNKWNYLNPVSEINEYCDDIYNRLEISEKELFENYEVFFSLLTLTKGSMKLLREIFFTLLGKKIYRVDRNSVNTIENSLMT